MKQSGRRRKPNGENTDRPAARAGGRPGLVLPCRPKGSAGAEREGLAGLAAVRGILGGVG